MASLKEFRRLYPPTFDGIAGGQAAEEWLEQVRRIFDTLETPENQRVKLATFQLLEQANHWWKTVESSGRVGSWNEFQNIFLDHFFLRVQRNSLMADFIHLIQRDTQYQARFNALSRYASHLVAIEHDRIWHFQRGLRPSIRRSVELDEYRQIRDSRKRFGQQNTGNRSGNKRSREFNRESDMPSRGQFQRTGDTQGSSQRICSCYECVQPDHIRNDCPRLKGKQSQSSNVNQSGSQQYRPPQPRSGRPDMQR
ncbi:uncharacterized protein LOC132304585 [Cornus florida]|uniref:uncharacterized protein LOC132304585 n=1 Tax=Cornus florida TaxID=4283 RepID=UPI00289CAE2D|nr:uncharacterized protein LOC132304585 [Cornus florida]